MIELTPPMAIERHQSLAGQLSLLPGLNVLKRWGRILMERLGDRWPPRIESIRQLEMLCEQGSDREFWECVRTAAESELGSLTARRAEWMKSSSFDVADVAVTEEVNLMLSRVFAAEENEPAKEHAMAAAAPRKMRTPKSPKQKAESTESADVAVGVWLANEITDIDLNRLVPSPYQTRGATDPAWLEELADDLRRHKQLNPCLVRPAKVPNLWELIGGHTRTEAAKSLGWKSIKCRVVECDDATAQRLVLIDNAKRRELTLFERAQAMADLVEQYRAEGLGQRKLAADLGINQAEVSNMVRLLNLPDCIRELVITEEITKTQARSLLPYCDLPALWGELRADLETCDTFDDALRESLATISRPRSGVYRCATRGGWLSVAFEPTAEQEKPLDFRRSPLGEERAFNVTLWEELQEAGLLLKKSAAAEGGGTSSPDKVTTVDPEKAKAQHKRRLYRWKLKWLQARIVAALPASDVTDLLPVLLVWFALRGSDNVHHRRAEIGELFELKESWMGTDPLDVVRKLLEIKSGPERSERIRTALQRWVAHSAEGSTDMPAEFIEQLADWLHIDIVGQWWLETEFLELMNSEQLRDLAKEWKLTPPEGKRAELLAWLLEEGKGKPCPKAIKTLKPVNVNA